MRRPGKRMIQAAALASAMTIVTAMPAAAQIGPLSPCIVLGSPLPPPCIAFDYKKLADIATKNAQDLQRIQATIQTVEQAKAATQGIISDARSLPQFSITMPQIDATPGPIFSQVASQARAGIASMASTSASKMYSGAGAGIDASSVISSGREKIAADVNTESYGIATTAPNEAKLAEARYAELSKAISTSPDLAGDWVVNSEIKEELIKAGTRQSYLMAQFIKMQAANNILTTQIAQPSQTMQPSAMVNKTIAATTPTDMSAQVRQLMDLYAQAQLVTASLNVVQMTGSIQSGLQGQIDDYQNTVARKNQALAQLQNDARQWRTDSHKGDSTNTVNSITASLTSVDSQMNRLKSEPIESLGGAFAARNLDVTTLSQSDVDPRQFIGTWGDPLKYQTVQDVASGLLNGSLRGNISKSDQTQFKQDIYNFQDASLEANWKKGFADDAAAQIAASNNLIAAENTQQGSTVTQANATAQLQDIVSQANALGQQISAGSDDGSKARAAELLAQIQTVVGAGTSLPYVDQGQTANTATNAVTTVTGAGATAVAPVVSDDVAVGRTMTKTGQEN